MKVVTAADLVSSFLNSMEGHAIVLLNVEGMILTWNAGAGRIFGYEASEVLRLPFSLLYRKSDIEVSRLAASFKEAIAQGRYEETSPRVRKDGTEFEAHCVIQPLRDSDGVHIGWGNLILEMSRQGVVVGSDTNGRVSQTKTILVVDDDEHVRELTIQQLTSLGYRVLSAADGPAALTIMRGEPAIDLLLSDVVMPGGLNGGQLAEEAKLLKPGLKCIFISGYFPEALVRNGSVAPDARVLVKPYRKAQLAQMILEALNSPPISPQPRLRIITDTL